MDFQVHEQTYFLSLAEDDNQWEVFVATPTGVGLDVPEWLRRLEGEVQRTRATRSPVAVLAEELFRVPQRLVEYEDLQNQIKDWDLPIIDDK